MIRIRKIVRMFLTDTFLAAILLGGIWTVNYLIPHKGVKALTLSARIVEQNKESVTIAKGGPAKDQTFSKTLKGGAAEMEEGNYEGIQTKIILDKQDWKKKFPEKFTDKVVSMDTSYTSPNVSVTLDSYSYNSGKLDKTEGGKHLQYGTRVAYTVADIYISNISCFQTAFAKDTYGIGYEEKISDMSHRIQAAFSINGDSYSNNQHRDNGTIIRNGILYRRKQTDMETCVLNWDGTMKIYQPGQMNTEKLIEEGAYQSWIFGPSLLDKNGKAKTDFLTWDYIRDSHPRTAIGYYEPGHYCMVLVDGRQTDYSRGMFLEELSKVFEDLGCKAAYNLDGGHSSFMMLQGKTVSHPYKPEHAISDGIFLTEGI